MEIPHKFIDKTDLDLAAAVQKALLKYSLPPDMHDRIVVKNRMSGQVGGDFYTVEVLNEDQIAFTIGDVMGHGTSAALIMSQVVGLLNIGRENHSHPQRMVEYINDMLVNLGKLVNHPVTCSLIYGVVDLPSGNLFYVNAGHPHPLVINRESGVVDTLGPTTMILGVRPGARPESCHQFVGHDRLILITDGFLDGKNTHDEYYGHERFLNSIKETASKNARTAADSLFKGMFDFAGGREIDDDQTLMIIDFDKTCSTL